VFPVGGDTVKSLLFARLKHNEPGAGYLHFFPTTPSDYYEELTAEKQVMRFKNGFPERHWVKRPNAANEAVDELVYAYAALHRLYMVYDKRTLWDQMERKLEAPGERKEAVKATPQRRKSFVSQW
jgi:phage terminase large subunit GpA-like protein